MSASYLVEMRLPVLRDAAKSTKERGAFWPSSCGPTSDVAYRLISENLLAYHPTWRACVITEAGLAELARLEAVAA